MIQVSPYSCSWVKNKIRKHSFFSLIFYFNNNEMIYAIKLYLYRFKITIIIENNNMNWASLMANTNASESIWA